MIINIRHKESLISLDLRLKEIRYLKNAFCSCLIRRRLITISLDNDDIEGYDYLFKNDVRTFLICLIMDLRVIGVKANLNDLKNNILTVEEDNKISCLNNKNAWGK